MMGQTMVKEHCDVTQDEKRGTTMYYSQCNYNGDHATVDFSPSNNKHSSIKPFKCTVCVTAFHFKASLAKVYHGHMWQ